MRELAALVTSLAVRLDEVGADTMEVSYLLEWFENVFLDPTFEGSAESLAAKIIEPAREREELDTITNFDAPVLQELMVGFAALLGDGPILRGADWMDVEEALLDAYMAAGLE